MLDSGKIMYGAVGAGKTLAAVGYYVEKESPRDLYVITTAKKRDSLDWYGEAAKFGIGMGRDITLHGVITVDSWNNIGRYLDVENAFFVFDEQRLIGTGSWVKAFLKIAKKNRWIMLSATPGEVWLDYAPVFVANGYYRSISEFKQEHVVYAPFVKYPKVLRYRGEARLERLRDEVCVEMPYWSSKKRVENWLAAGYDKEMYNQAVRTRWNPFEDRPMETVSDLFRVCRRIVNSDRSRLELLREIMKMRDRIIVFYNFDYELEILRELVHEVPFAEWNGHKHQPIPDTDKWLFVVQYTAGSEGWNCPWTDTIVYWSLTYSYKAWHQSKGRIDRLNSPYETLYYYMFLSDSPLDANVKRALDRKKTFTERRSEQLIEVKSAH